MRAATSAELVMQRCVSSYPTINWHVPAKHCCLCVYPFLMREQVSTLEFGGEIFMRGAYLEVGMAQKGYFGTHTAPYLLNKKNGRYYWTRFGSDNSGRYNYLSWAQQQENWEGYSNYEYLLKSWGYHSASDDTGRIPDTFQWGHKCSHGRGTFIQRYGLEGVRAMLTLSSTDAASTNPAAREALLFEARRAVNV